MKKIQGSVADAIPEKRLLPGIHALRAIAALTILLFHLRYMADILPPTELQKTIGGHFFAGVVLFFVLSAFSLSFSTTPTTNSKTWIQDYLIKRFFRIAPLFYCMLGIYPLFFLFKHWAVPDLPTWMMNFTFLFNLVPGKHEGIVWASWTIGVEVLFYVVFPIFLLIPNRPFVHAVVLLCGIAVSVSARALIDQAPALEGYGKFAFISSLGVFVTGFVSFKVFERARHKLEAGTLRPVTVKAVCAVVSCLCLVAIFSPVGFTDTSVGRPDLMAWSLMFGAVAIWQALYPSPWLANRLLQWIGERSYGVYLLHPLVIGALSPWLKRLYVVSQTALGNWAFFVVGAVTILIVLAGADVAYRLIERPGMRFGRHLLERLSYRGTLVARQSHAVHMSCM